MKYHSGLYYPNQWAADYFNSYAPAFDIKQPWMVYKMLGLAELQWLGWDGFPGQDMKREIDFAYITAYTQVYNDMFEAKARKIMLESGQRWYQTLLPFLPPSPSLHDLARMFTQHSDQITEVETHADHDRFIIRACPLCTRPDTVRLYSPFEWLNKLPLPVCIPFVGLLQATVPEAKHVDEIECLAKGGAACIFVIQQ